MNTPLTATYRPIRLPERPSPADLGTLNEPYAAMIVSQCRAIVDRTERSEHYPWLDTKLDLSTGRELPVQHPLLGRDLVSGWVQGRGLETLVGFGRWLAPYAGAPEVDALLSRVWRLAADLLDRLRAARRLNAGHLFFYMTPEGRAFQLDADLVRVPLHLDTAAPANYSDLFSAKGMYAAAHYLGDHDALVETRAFCMSTYEAILGGRFASDQPPPARGAAAWIAEATPHGPYMIALGMAALFAQHEPGPEATAIGLRLARQVWEHVNTAGKWPALQDHDLVEYLDGDGGPYADSQGRIISDPGHSLEYVGLFLKFNAIVQRQGGATPDQAAELAVLARQMPALLARNFTNGFRPEAGGICKTVDLLTRAPVDATMPWWSLPETIRAAAGCWRLASSDAERAVSLAILAQCHNAFTQHYVRPDLHLMAVKVRDAGGRVLDFNPAYPDADPGYHTALSLMDTLAWVEIAQAP